MRPLKPAQIVQVEVEMGRRARCLREAIASASTSSRAMALQRAVYRSPTPIDKMYEYVDTGPQICVRIPLPLSRCCNCDHIRIIGGWRRKQWNGACGVFFMSLRRYVELLCCSAGAHYLNCPVRMIVPFAPVGASESPFG